MTLVGANGPWLDEAAKSVEHAPGVLNVYRVANDERAGLFVDVDDEVSGGVVLARLQAFDAGAKRPSVKLVNQVYPTSWWLLRDRELRT